MEVASKGVQLDKDEWGLAINRLSKALTGKPAAVEIAATAADSLTLLGVTFDRCDDIVEVATEDFDHMIRRPREVYLNQNDGK